MRLVIELTSAFLSSMFNLINLYDNLDDNLLNSLYDKDDRKSLLLRLKIVHC